MKIKTKIIIQIIFAFALSSCASLNKKESKYQTTTHVVWFWDDLWP